MNVLIAVDQSEHAQSLLDATVRLLQAALGEVWLLHVAEPDPDFVGYEMEPTVMRDQLAEGFHREHRQLQAMAEALRGQGIAATALLIQGETVKTIVQQAEKLKADLIVVGASGHGLWHHFLAGEVSQASLQASGRPLLVMPLSK
jgi:nucleotide-binding universal stress UspA family protein